VKTQSKEGDMPADRIRTAMTPVSPQWAGALKGVTGRAALQAPALARAFAGVRGQSAAAEAISARFRVQDPQAAAFVAAWRRAALGGRLAEMERAGALLAGARLQDPTNDRGGHDGRS